MSRSLSDVVQVMPLYQLQQIQSQIAYQSHQHLSQMQLTNVLFQTEQRARQLEVVAKQDSFAAGLMSAMWLESLSGVRTELFYGMEEKRIWQTVSAKLQALQAEVWKEALLRDDAQCFFRAMQDEVRFQRLLGDDPKKLMAELCSREAAQADLLKDTGHLWLISLFAVGVSCVLASSDEFFSLLALLASGVLVIVSVVWLYVHHSLSPLRGAVARAMPTFKDWEVFQVDMRRAPLLRMLCEKHVALVSPLPVVDMSVPSRESVVERQTVVARCKYCQSLTPVDAPGCQQCGAHKFI